MDIVKHVHTIWLAISFFLIPMFSAHALPRNPVEQCDHAAVLASQDTAVPLAILWALTRTETGHFQNKTLVPWPWTVNAAGTGHWLITKQQALKTAKAAIHKNAKSTDIGCFQLNYHWHGKQFGSLANMLDPMKNAAYAAKFLGQLYQETGNWISAAGRFHSRTEKYARPYRQRFQRILSGFEPASQSVRHPFLAIKPSGSDGHQNQFPLLKAGLKNTAHGSLMPLAEGSQSALFDRSPSR